MVEQLKNSHHISWSVSRKVVVCLCGGCHLGCSLFDFLNVARHVEGAYMKGLLQLTQRKGGLRVGYEYQCRYVAAETVVKEGCAKKNIQ